MSELLLFVAYIIAWISYSYSVGVILFIGKYIENEDSSFFKAFIWPVFDRSRNLIGVAMAAGLGLASVNLITL